MKLCAYTKICSKNDKELAFLIAGGENGQLNEKMVKKWPKVVLKNSKNMLINEEKPHEMISQKRGL